MSYSPIPCENKDNTDNECVEATTLETCCTSDSGNSKPSNDENHIGSGDDQDTKEAKGCDTNESGNVKHSQSTGDGINLDSSAGKTADLSKTEMGDQVKTATEQSAGNSDNTAESAVETDENEESGRHVDSKEECDEEANGSRLESCSEDSGSDGEYESADEGEEIHMDAENLRDMEEQLTEEDKEERRLAAQALKEEGNELFKTGTYKTAIRTYSRALRTCPLKFAKDRAIMYSNRAACKMRLDEMDDAVRDCTKALDLHPHYLKARMRRAELYEKLDKLDEALADFQKIVEQEPSQYGARAACARLPPLIQERNDKMKEEMMGKLKDLGNMVLRPFGLSTNNFALNQDPNTGGYSVNFVQSPDKST